MTLTVVSGQNVTLETVVTGPWGCLLGLTEEGYLGDVEIVEGGGGWGSALIGFIKYDITNSDNIGSINLPF